MPRRAPAVGTRTRFSLADPRDPDRPVDGGVDLGRAVDAQRRAAGDSRRRFPATRSRARASSGPRRASRTRRCPGSRPRSGRAGRWPAAASRASASPSRSRRARSAKACIAARVSRPASRPGRRAAPRSRESRRRTSGCCQCVMPGITTRSTSARIASIDSPVSGGASGIRAAVVTGRGLRAHGTIAHGPPILGAPSRDLRAVVRKFVPVHAGFAPVDDRGEFVQDAHCKPGLAPGTRLPSSPQGVSPASRSDLFAIQDWKTLPRIGAILC